MHKTFQRHLHAIQSGKVDRSNIIGLRKAFNAHLRDARGLSISTTAPAYATSTDTIETLERAVMRHAPLVIGDWYDSGLATLRSKRYESNLTDHARNVLATDKPTIQLVDWYYIDSLHVTPVYLVTASDGRDFRYINIPWQSGGNGPRII